MDAGRTIGADGHTWVPNRFVFTLSAQDHERFAAAESAITAEAHRSSPTPRANEPGA